MNSQLLKSSTTNEVVYQIRTLEEAHQLSVLIANETPNPVENLIISELMFNAIEHGNLGISFEEKAFLIENDIFLDEVQRRLQLPENQHKRAHVIVRQNAKQMHVCITDMGSGFDYSKYLTIDESRIFENNGRGIALVNSILEIRFNEKGNQVCVFLPMS
jgi:hypothetical protein